MRAIRFARILTVIVVGLLCMPGLGLSAAIKGKVVFVGAVPPAKKVDITIDQYVCGTAKDAGDLVLSPQKELRRIHFRLELADEHVDYILAVRRP